MGETGTEQAPRANGARGIAAGAGPAAGSAGTPARLVLFDGVCNLCSGSVDFMIDHDPGGALCFAALQSAAARDALGRALGKDRASAALPESGEDPGSVLLLEGDRLYQRSTAALRIARHLTWPWKALFVLLVVPRPLRDLLYRVVAKNRYRWFGKREACRVPTPELRGRFL